MVKSMTGYGRARKTLSNRDITVEVRSVNNRYLDCTVKLPRAYIFAEDAIKGRVQKAISRGKVDVFISIDSTGADEEVVAVNEGLARSYLAAFDKLCALDTLSAADADAFGADPDCGAIAALAAAADADRKTAAMVIQGVFGRAAKAIVANIAAIVFLTDGAKNRYRPMVVAVDGSLFRYSTLLRPAVSEELEAFLVQKHQRYCVCKPVPNASAIGTAAASLLQG